MSGQVISAFIFVGLFVYVSGFILTWKLLSGIYEYEIPIYVRFLTLLSWAGMVLLGVGWLLFGLFIVIMEVCRGESFDR